MSRWTCTGQIGNFENSWLRLVGERWQDDDDQALDYWRVEKADSLIIIPQQDDRLLLPQPMFRPGIGKTTWDFPGGRLVNPEQQQQTLEQILQRELKLPASALVQRVPINPEGWTVNSSFSNQRLYGFWVTIAPDFQWSAAAVAARFQIPSQLPDLLARLTCLQCRGLLREWQHHCLAS